LEKFNTDQPEKVLEKVAQKINQIEDKNLLPELTTCTHILAGLKLEKDLIKSLLKEEIMQSSVTYQDIKLQGKREGKIEGKIEGKREEALNLSIKIINQYLGDIDQDLLAQIESLSLEKLEELVLNVFNFDCVGDLELWLTSQD
jgi:predicted transposase YdaD